MFNLQQALQTCRLPAALLPTGRRLQRPPKAARCWRVSAFSRDSDTDTDAPAPRMMKEDLGLSSDSDGEVDIVTAEVFMTQVPGQQQDGDPSFWRAAGLSTGFPVPTGYAEGSRRSNKPGANGSTDAYDFYGRKSPPRPRRLQAEPQAGPSAPPGRQAHCQPPPGTGGVGEVRPVFRASPFFAEFQRQRTESETTRILFLDEGGEFRSLLGAALLRLMLGKFRTPLDVTVDFASIGDPVSAGIRDHRLHHIAAEMSIPLAFTPEEQLRGSARRFHEVSDAVGYDLIVVMDRFDYQEVLKEVAVLDAINPGGFYAGRIRRLGPFGLAAARSTLARVAEDIADPLYGMHTSAQAESEALQQAARELSFACRGLASYLLALHSRCGRWLSLREALSQSLQCPLLAGGMMPHRERLAAASAPGAVRPLALEGGVPLEELFTVRTVQGQRRVVRQRSRQHGYWRDAVNVEEELREWMQARRAERLPTQRELRRAGASSLAAAVDMHGGLAVFARRMGVPMAVRRPNGYWEEFKHLAAALKPYLAVARGADQAGSTAAGVTSRFCSLEYIMPTQARLLEAGRADLLRAIRQHGGSAAVAERLGVGVRRGSGFSHQELLHELQRCASVTGASNALPTRSELLIAGRNDLASAVTRLGGFAHFQQLASAEDGRSGGTALLQGATSTASKHPELSPMDQELLQTLAERRTAVAAAAAAPAREPVIDGVARQIMAFVRASASPSRVPTRQELLQAGRRDLWAAVQRAGGVRRVAEHLLLPFVETRGRRRLRDNQGSATASLREDIDILDAYEEVVFV